MKPKICVVIPCYNVERYVARCLDSVLDQTMSEFEVVCVNDGSTDETAKILERYAGKKRGVRVYSQENMGLAEARNAGVRCATADYVTFVDSDDYVSPYYLESLWDAHRELDADLVSCALKPVRSASRARIEREWARRGASKAMLVSGDELGSSILDERLSCAACGKLIPTELCRRHPFTRGRLHEDVEIIASYYFSACKCARIEDSLYAYYMRDGSITHDRAPGKKHFEDFLHAYQLLERTVCLHSTPSLSSLAHHRIVTASRFHAMVTKVPCEGALREAERNLIISANEALLRAGGDVAMKQRVRLFLLSNHPHVYDCIMKIYDGYIKGN